MLVATCFILRPWCARGERLRSFGLWEGSPISIAGQARPYRRFFFRNPFFELFVGALCSGKPRRSDPANMLWDAGPERRHVHRLPSELLRPAAGDAKRRAPFHPAYTPASIRVSEASIADANGLEERCGVTMEHADHRAYAPPRTRQPSRASRRASRNNRFVRVVSPLDRETSITYAILRPGVIRSNTGPELCLELNSMAPPEKAWISGRTSLVFSW